LFVFCCRAESGKSVPQTDAALPSPMVGAYFMFYFLYIVLVSLIDVVVDKVKLVLRHLEDKNPKLLSELGIGLKTQVLAMDKKS